MENPGQEAGFEVVLLADPLLDAAEEDFVDAEPSEPLLPADVPVEDDSLLPPDPPDSLEDDSDFAAALESPEPDAPAESPALAVAVFLSASRLSLR